MPRPRDARTDEAILAAARELFSEGGLEAASVEAIARRAGVGKQSVYRRHAGRNAVLAAAWLEDARARVDVPRGRDLEADLAGFLRALFSALETSGDAMRHLMAQAQFDEELRRSFADEFVEVRRDALGALVRAHVPDVDDHRLALVVDQLYGTMWYRLLVGHAPLDGRLAKSLAAAAANLIAGAR